MRVIASELLILGYPRAGLHAWDKDSKILGTMPGVSVYGNYHFMLIDVHDANGNDYP